MKASVGSMSSSALRPAEETAAPSSSSSSSSSSSDFFVEPLAIRRKLYPNLQSTGAPVLSVVLKLIYGAPQLVLHPAMLLVSLVSVEYYSSIGASYGYLLLGVALGRGIDLLLTPVVASVTDSFRSYYGRRKPFIFAGVWLYFLMLVLIFAPPAYFSSGQKAAWFCLTHIGFCVSHVFLSVPYDALGMELSAGYDDRASLWWYSSLFSNAGVFALFFVCSALPLVTYSSTSTAAASVGSASVPVSSVSCSPSSCYSASGVGTGCQSFYYQSAASAAAANWATDSPQSVQQSFAIFNATQWAAQPSSAAAISAAFAASPVHAAAKYGQCRVLGAAMYASPADLFQPSACIIGGTGDSATLQQLRNSGCLATYCQCVVSCQALCAEQAGRAPSLLGAALVVGGWLLLSVGVALYWLQERAALKSPFALLPAPGMAASLLTALRNPTLARLLAPWSLDSLVFALVAGLLPFYCKYIVRPETQHQETHAVECNGGLGRFGQTGNAFESAVMCRGDTASGVLVAALSLSAWAGSFGWRLAVARWGKKLTWIWGSLAVATALLGWIALGAAPLPSMPGAFAVTLVIGLALGAAWVTDSMVADAVEYEEFLSGQRLEASFSLWRSLLPKLASLAAFVFPVASLWSLGFVPPVGGLAQTQPAAVRTYVLVVGAALPTALALVSAWCKLTYPLRSREGVALVAEGVGQHMQQRAAMDPLTGADYCREHWAGEELLLPSTDGKGGAGAGAGVGGGGGPGGGAGGELMHVLLLDNFPLLEGQPGAVASAPARALLLYHSFLLTLFPRSLSLSVSHPPLQTPWTCWPPPPPGSPSPPRATSPLWPATSAAWPLWPPLAASWPWP